MGHHKGNSWFRKISIWDFVVLGIGGIGIGMVLAVFLPFWIWIVMVGICLIAYSVWYYNTK